MAEASIPVDLLNPGQVFACLGFLEAVDKLLGDAEGGFDWSNETRVRFTLRADSRDNPFGEVLRWLASAEIMECVPPGHVDPTPVGERSATDEDDSTAASAGPLELETYPSRVDEAMARPLRLHCPGGVGVELGHWADGSGRSRFKLYSGNRSACGIATAMLRGIADLWAAEPVELAARPFEVLMPLGGSFNFDARSAWTAMDTGFSIDRQKKKGNIIGVEASPVVQLLAAWGLEHARPTELRSRRGDEVADGGRWVRYGAWSTRVLPMLARPALAGLSVGVPIRSFLFRPRLSGKNKIVTFAQEEVRA